MNLWREWCNATSFFYVITEHMRYKSYYKYYNIFNYDAGDVYKNIIIILRLKIKNSY